MSLNDPQVVRREYATEEHLRARWAVYEGAPGPNAWWSEHRAELWRLVGRVRASEPWAFDAESGETALRRHFARVERRDFRSSLTFADADAVCAKHLADQVPQLDEPLVATRAQCVFVAETAT